MGAVGSGGGEEESAAGWPVTLRSLIVQHRCALRFGGVCSAVRHACGFGGNFVKCEQGPRGVQPASWADSQSNASFMALGGDTSLALSDLAFVHVPDGSDIDFLLAAF